LYFIGIDGGSAYSRLVAADENDTVIGRHTGGTSNFKIRSKDTIADNLRRLVSEFFRLTDSKIEDCGGICVGCSCIQTAEDVESMIEILSKIGFERNIHAVHDAEIILAAETKGEEGAIVVAGTDTTGYAVDKHQNRYRCGGWGKLDGGGSTVWIGNAAVKHALMCADGRREQSPLATKVFERFKVESAEKLSQIITHPDFNTHRIGELATVVRQTSQAGDETAKQIEQSAANELALVASALIKRAKIESPKIVAGGAVLVSNENILKAFTSLIAERESDVTVIPAKGKAELGAVYIAKTN
jgi:N-acetylglucosamine kinase-like BadF-type ATPase